MRENRSQDRLKTISRQAPVVTSIGNGRPMFRQFINNDSLVLQLTPFIVDPHQVRRFFIALGQQISTRRNVAYKQACQ